MSGTGGDAVTPELALVDPELLEAQRQTTEGKAAMSSTEPSNGTFFVDPAQPAPAPTTPEAVPAPTLAPAPDAVPAQPPAPTPAPAPAAAGAFATPMVDVPLGTLIFRAGLLAEEQLEDALQEGMRTGKRLGEVLLERGWLHERDLGRMLAGQKGLPFVEISAADAEPEALAALPPSKAMLQTTLPLRYEEGQLVVAVADPSNELVLENLRRALGAEPRLVVAAHGDLTRAIQEAYTRTASPTVEVTTPEPQPVESAPVQILQPEPPQPAPPVTPLPTVLPAAEERFQEPLQPAPLQQPLVVEPAAEVAVEPAAEVVVEPAAEVVAETPVVLQEPVVQPFVEYAPAPVPETTLAAQPEPSAPLEATIPTLLRPEPVLEPPAPALPAEAPVQVPEVSVPEAAPVPLAPEPFEPVPALPIQPEPTVAPEPPAAVEPVAVEPELGASLHIVLLRLREGDVLQVGTFRTAAEASARAREVVREIAAAEGASTWPFFAERYLRPDAIVSVDLLEEHADKWMGSAARARWAQA